MVIFVVIHYAVTKAHQQHGICIATKPHMPLLWQDCESLSKLFFPLNSSLRGYKTLAEGASLVFGNCYALVEARGWKCGSSSVMSVRGGLCRRRRCTRSPCVSLSHCSLLLLQAKTDIIMATGTASAAGNGLRDMPEGNSSSSVY